MSDATDNRIYREKQVEHRSSKNWCDMGDFDRDLANVEQIRHTLEDMRKNGLRSGLQQDEAFALLGFIDNLWKAYTFEINRAADEPPATPPCSAAVEAAAARVETELSLLDDIDDQESDPAFIADLRTLIAHARAAQPPSTGPGTIDLADADAVSLRCQVAAGDAAEDGLNKTTETLNSAAETIDALVAALRTASPPTCVHPWEKVGINADGRPFCVECLVDLVKDPPWRTAESPPDSLADHIRANKELADNNMDLRELLRNVTEALEIGKNCESIFGMRSHIVSALIDIGKAGLSATKNETQPYPVLFGGVAVETEAPHVGSCECDECEARRQEEFRRMGQGAGETNDAP